MSCFTFSGSSFNVHQALYNTSCEILASLTAHSWRNILAGTASALVYLYNCGILHNDLKCDNVVLSDSSGGGCTGVTIDFGKACYNEKGQKYSLSRSEQQRYLRKYLQIPPDVISGVSMQSHASDIYAFGRIIRAVNTEKLSIPYFQSLIKLSLETDATKRPTAKDIYTSLQSLL